jgi:hypothetical protein
MTHPAKYFQIFRLLEPQSGIGAMMHFERASVLDSPGTLPFASVASARQRGLPECPPFRRVEIRAVIIPMSHEAGDNHTRRMVVDFSIQKFMDDETTPARKTAARSA